jgi:hypothetical protein
MESLEMCVSEADEGAEVIDPPRFDPTPIPKNVRILKELEEAAWYRQLVDRNNIRFERAKAAGA